MEKADIVIFCKNIFTGIDEGTISGGIAVKGNKILAVGAVEEYIGESTLVEDIGDRLITAGFCDSHVHMLMGCMMMEEANLEFAKSEEEAAAMLYHHFCKNEHKYSADDWVIGFSWYNFWWDKKDFPTKWTLDRYFLDRPVFLLNADGHGGWVNSKALELAGINNDTPNPPYGTIYRDANGEATGYLDENAMSLCILDAFNISPEREKKYYENNLSLYSKVGLTAVNDMQYFFGVDMGNKDVFKALEKEDKLPIRINFATGLLGDIAQMEEYQSSYSTGKIYYNGTKEFIDGLIITHTALMTAPYSDAPKADYKSCAVNLNLLKRKIVEVQKKGINIQLHATGDGAVKYCLDSYQMAIEENGFTQSRLSIEHIDLLEPSDLNRFGKYGVIASIQPQHLALTEKYEDCPYPKSVGEERERYLWAYKSIADNGGVLAFGTDYPTAGVNPMMSIYRAVTRLFDNKEPKNGWNAHEKLSVAQAIKGYTKGSAYKIGREKELGTIEPNKLADLTIIDENILAMPYDKIPKTKIYATMCDGKFTYRSNN